MAVKIESSTTDGPNFSKPSGLSEGDLMVAFVFQGFGVQAPSAPSGFTNIENVEGPNDYGTSYVYTKEATSSDASSSNFDFSNGKGILYRITGSVTTAANIKSNMGNISSSSDDLSVSFSPRHNDTVLLGLFGNANNSSNSYFLDESKISITSSGTSPSFTEDYDSGSGGNSAAAANATYSDSDDITSFNSDYGGEDDTQYCLLVIEKPTDASGSSTILKSSSSIFTSNGSGATSGNASLLDGSPSIFTQSGTGEEPTVWTNESTNTTNWTNET